MNLTYSQQVFDNHVHVRVQGATASVRELLRLIEAVAKRSHLWRRRQLLLDFTGLPPVPDPLSQALVGDHVGAQLAHVERIASLAPLDPLQHFERAARRNGANMKSFNSEPKALEWLLQVG